jgi:hypothetical protein
MHACALGPCKNRGAPRAQPAAAAADWVQLQPPGQRIADGTLGVGLQDRDHRSSAMRVTVNIVKRRPFRKTVGTHMQACQAVVGLRGRAPPALRRCKLLCQKRRCHHDIASPILTRKSSSPIPSSPCATVTSCTVCNCPMLALQSSSGGLTSPANESHRLQLPHIFCFTARLETTSWSAHSQG